MILCFILYEQHVKSGVIISKNLIRISRINVLIPNSENHMCLGQAKVLQWAEYSGHGEGEEPQPSTEVPLSGLLQPRNPKNIAFSCQEWSGY